MAQGYGEPTSSDSSDSVCSRMGKRLSVCRNIWRAERQGTCEFSLARAGSPHTGHRPSPTDAKGSSSTCHYRARQGFSGTEMAKTLPSIHHQAFENQGGPRKSPWLGGASWVNWAWGLTLRGVLI